LSRHYAPPSAVWLKDDESGKEPSFSSDVPPLRTGLR
jgi:hypothetical protein